MTAYVLAASALALMAGCSDDDLEARRDGGLRGNLDASLHGPAPQREGGWLADAPSLATPPTVPSASAAACAESPLPAPADRCGSGDLTEPNSERAPARVEVAPHCGLVHAFAADKDQDAYRFGVQKSDPVKVELSYRAEQRADLALALYDLSGRELKRAAQRRQSALEHEQLVWPARAGASYDVRVEGELLGTCLPYALRIDPSYCSDAHEDNDGASSASQLSLDAQQQVSVTGTISEGDADFFELVTPKADPLLLTGTVTVAPDDTLQLRRVLDNTAGLGGFDVAGARVGASETFSHWLLSNRAGALFRAQLAGIGSGCARYQLRFDAAACSDAFEDNETALEAATIPAAQPLGATSFRGDDDYYDLSSLGESGLCSVTYEVSPQSTDALRLTVWSGATPTASAAGTSQAGEQSLRIRWSGPTSVLQVVGTSASCLPYTLRCEPGPPAQ